MFAGLKNGNGPISHAEYAVTSGDATATTVAIATGLISIESVQVQIRRSGGFIYRWNSHRGERLHLYADRCRCAFLAGYWNLKVSFAPGLDRGGKARRNGGAGSYNRSRFLSTFAMKIEILKHIELNGACVFGQTVVNHPNEKEWLRAGLARPVVEFSAENAVLRLPAPNPRHP